jgi:hypothetical protein
MGCANDAAGAASGSDMAAMNLKSLDAILLKFTHFYADVLCYLYLPVGVALRGMRC